MGRIEAANATSDAIRRWHPRYVLLIGIAGGIAERDVGLGDIIVSSQIVDYELQKLPTTEPEVRYEVHRVDPRLLGAAKSLKAKEWQSLITTERPAKGKPKCSIGPIATGDKVIASADTLRKYRDSWPKLIGVEMEAGGASSACFQAASQPGFFMVRGISDLADSAKNAEHVRSWRGYACDVAASYVVALLQSGPVPIMPATGARSEKGVLPETWCEPSSTTSTEAQQKRVPRGLEPFASVVWSGDAPEKMRAILSQQAPPFERILCRAMAAAARAFDNADRADLRGDRARLLIGESIARAQKKIQEKMVLRVPSRLSDPKDSNLGAVLWNSGDEYVGEFNGRIEYGVGVYKIYAISRRQTPDYISYYKGEVRNGEFGQYGVYYFPSGSCIAGEWVDNRPAFGYQDIATWWSGGDYDFYFGSFGETRDRNSSHIWRPHGFGVAGRIRSAEFVCGDFDYGEIDESKSHVYTWR
jgi:nucleoside phosphorylase